MPSVNCVRMKGLVDYETMMERQQAARGAVASGEMASTVFFLEHPPTITLGRNALADHVLCDSAGLAKAGVRLLATDRGGDVTYHGPGQMVAYPVLDLNQWTPSVDWYLRALEETVIRLLDSYGLKGERIPEYTGVWVNGEKVAAVGIAIKKWISWHGFAINVNPNMEHWRLIVPCGIKNKPVTTLDTLLSKAPPMEQVVDRCITAFQDVFACDVIETTIDTPGDD